MKYHINRGPPVRSLTTKCHLTLIFFKFLNKNILQLTSIFNIISSIKYVLDILENFSLFGLLQLQTSMANHKKKNKVEFSNVHGYLCCSCMTKRFNIKTTSCMQQKLKYIFGSKNDFYLR